MYNNVFFHLLQANSFLDEDDDDLDQRACVWFSFSFAIVCQGVLLSIIYIIFHTLFSVSF
jgi:hypothetical protein